MSEQYVCKLCGRRLPAARVYFFKGSEWAKYGLSDGDAVCDQCITRIFPPIQSQSDPMQPSPDATPLERLRWEYGRRERQLLEEVRRLIEEEERLENELKGLREERDRLVEEVRRLRGGR
jgi:hypothetical protein